MISTNLYKKHTLLWNQKLENIQSTVTEIDKIFSISWEWREHSENDFKNAYEWSRQVTNDTYSGDKYIHDNERLNIKLTLVE